MTAVEVVGIYPVLEAPEPCHLVEVIVRDSPGFDIGAFQQEQPGQPPDNWQAPWDERILNAEGDKVTAEYQIDPEALRGTVRLAFFLHHLEPSRPLLTPFGSTPLPEQSERPERLAMIEYEEP